MKFCTVLLEFIKSVCIWLHIENQVDAGHIYGDTLDRQLDLRLHEDGKLKYQVPFTS